MASILKIGFTIFLNIAMIFISFSQDLVKGEVVDQSTGITLPYATVLNTRTLTGTATNQNGYFELRNTSNGDTLEASFVGYQKAKIIVSEGSFIRLELLPVSNVIDEVVISASDDRWYDLIQKVRKKKKTKELTSKTYFYLESNINGHKSEVIESYYNGKFAHHGINDLKLKKGRIGLDSIDGRYFLSTGTSRTFILHDIFNSNKKFPGNPLNFGKRKLNSRYWLTSNRQFNSQNGLITVVDFEPKSKYKEELFEGSMQISEHGDLITIYMKKSNSQLYPFIPFGGIKINGLDLEIHKIYHTINDEQYINSVDFNYTVHYNDRDGKPVEINSYAYCKAFDYGEVFELPIFEFSEHMHEDYRDMTAAPYDTTFWELYEDFRFNDKLVENEKFILNNQFPNSFVIHQDSTKGNQLESPYYNWSDIRFKINPLSLKKRMIEREKTIFESDLYNLNTKLYLDINQVNDSIIYQLVSILDPVDTYYKLEIEVSDHYFMNMYFDLLEYHRIRMDNILQNQSNLTIESIKILREEVMQIYKEDLKQFVKETDRGKNWIKMKEWNEYLFQLTKVNNDIVDLKK